MPKVSVIIPAYNAMKFLPETLESVLQQTYEDFEVLIINDGSQDDIETWFQKQQDPRVKLISQSNKGLAGARNTGIRHSQGEYLSFLDADDIWLPQKLEKQVKTFQDNPTVGLVYTGIENINEQGVQTGRTIQHHIEGKIWEALTQHNYIECGSVAMVKRHCFEDCGVFDTNLGSFLEDWDMWLRIAPHYSFKVISEVLVQYRQHAASASKNWDAMASSFTQVMEKNFPEPSPLKDESMGHFNLYCLAWKPLQCQTPDYRKAIRFQQEAFNFDPSLRYSRENLRLTIAINLMRLLGPIKYDVFMKRMHQLRALLQAVFFNRTFKSAHG